MNSIKQTFLIISVILSSNLFGQDISLKWSDPVLLDNKVDGFFRAFLSENEKYVYAKFSTYSKKDKYKIVSFDKKTMKKVSSTPIIGYDVLAQEEKKYKGLSYLRTIVYEKYIYVFFTSYDKKTKKKKYLVKSYSPTLKPLKGLTELTSISTDTKDGSKTARVFIIGNPEIGKVFIGKEKAGRTGDKYKLEYKVLNADLSISTAKQVTLPLVIEETKSWFSSSVNQGLSSSYEYGDDGNLHIRSLISYTKEEIIKKKKKKKRKTGTKRGIDRSYTLFSVVNLDKGKIKSIPIKSADKRIFSIFRKPGKDNTKLFGYFSDTKKDKYGRATHGIFYCILNKKYEIENMKFSYFTKAQITEMFKNDKDDANGGRASGCCMTRKKGNTHADKESLSSEYVIEQAIVGDNNEVYLFASILSNRTRQVCTTNNGVTTCRTEYYCVKKNVTTFKLDEKGKMVWASNHDRIRTYNGWNVYDLSVIQGKEGFYALFGSKLNSKKKTSPWWMFKKKDITNPFEFIFIKEKTGKVKRKEMNVNKANTPKKERKRVLATSVSVIDNKFYIDYSHVGLKPIGYGVFCLGGCMMPSLINNFKVGQGYFGVIEPLKKKK
jgi:hypothetical protein